MPDFTINHEGTDYHVDAPDENAAVSAFKKMQGLVPDPRAAYGATATQHETMIPPSPEATRRAALASVLEGVPIAGPKLAPIAGATPEQRQQFQSYYPGQDWLAGQLGAAAVTAPAMAVAPAVFGAAKGVTTGANAFMGGVGGGAIGAADAYARGQNPYVGGAVGAVAGAGSPALARGVGKGVEAMAPGVPPQLQGYSNTALEWAAKLARNDGLNDAQIMSRLQQLGPEGFLAEYGPNLKAGASFVAARPGTGKAMITGGIEDRAAASRQRVEDAVTQVAGPRQNMADITRNSIQARAMAADPLYQAWRSTVVPPTPELNALVAPLNAAGALQSANRKMALADRPVQIPFGNGKAYTAEAWDYAKRALDDKIEVAKRAGNNDDARLYTQLKNRLTSAIDNHPDQNVAGVWKAARQTFADHSAIMDARDAGRDVFNPKVRSDELGYQFQGYSQPQMQAFAEGVRDNIATLMDHSTRGENDQIKAGTFNKLIDPEGQRKLSMFYGPQAADTLTNALKREMIFNATQSKVVQNSETAARQAVGEMMTPDPSNNVVSYLRNLSSVQLGKAIPNAVEQYAGQRQMQKFEKARDEIAPILMSKGASAADLAKALMAYQPGGKYAPAAQAGTNLLLQAGAAPAVRRKAGEWLQ